MKGIAFALAVFFSVVQFYTSLAPLSPTPPVGYVFVSRAGAALLVAVLVGAALVILVRLVRERIAPPVASRAVLTWWIGAAALSSALGLAPVAGFEVVGIMLLTGLFHLGVVRFYARPGVAATLVATFLVTGLVASLAALAMLVARRPAGLWALNHGRAAGFFVTANQCAAFLIAFLFVALGVALGGPKRLRRLGAVAATAGGVALLATFSVAGLLGVAVAGSAYCAMLGARRAAAAIVLATALAAGAFALAPAARHDPAEKLDRLRIWEAGLRVAELFPLTGVGPMTYFEVYPAVRPPNGDLPGTFGALHPHDVYLSLAGELGVTGLVATAAGWIRFGRAFRTGVRALDPAGRRFACGTAAALIAVLVQGLFDTIGVVEMAFVWIPFTGLALAAAHSGLPPGRRSAG